MRAVAIGGGHGTATAIRALSSLGHDVSAVVSVADNGGSTGRLRDLLDVAAVGDIRMCLSAMADPTSSLAQSFEHRFSVGELRGHPVGNLLLVGMLDATGDNLEDAVQSVADLLGVKGFVFPASTSGVTLIADTSKGVIKGQRQISETGSIQRIRIEPANVATPIAAVEAIERADVVVIGPGSLFTSVIAAGSVPGVSQALAGSSATKIYVANLLPQIPETENLSLMDQLQALVNHGITFDHILIDQNSPFSQENLPENATRADIARDDGRVHDVAKLADAISKMVER